MTCAYCCQGSQTCQTVITRPSHHRLEQSCRQTKPLRVHPSAMAKKCCHDHSWCCKHCCCLQDMSLCQCLIDSALLLQRPPAAARAISSRALPQTACHTLTHHTASWLRPINSIVPPHKYTACCAACFVALTLLASNIQQQPLLKWLSSRRVKSCCQCTAARAHTSSRSEQSCII